MKRRTFVKQSALTAFSVAAFGAINFNGKSFEGTDETTTDILGPFYRPGAPMRTNLIPPGSTGQVMKLYGTVYKQDGKTPMKDTLIEAWQCDEHELYDNTSDDYRFRGAVKTGADGKYEFKTIVPVPYKIGGDEWRPAHVHYRVSSADHQDLITQIYFKGDPHLAEDPAATAASAVKRILDIKVNGTAREVRFDIVMKKNIALDDAAYRKITGIYRMENGMCEFKRDGDLLLMKYNGQYVEGMAYLGNNTFGGGLDYYKVNFEILSDGGVKAKVQHRNWTDLSQSTTDEGLRYLKYEG
jgi:catechol 1,2-dioxygenase